MNSFYCVCCVMDLIQFAAGNEIIDGFLLWLFLY